MRPRRYLLAIPPESGHDQMTRFHRVGGGLYFVGQDQSGTDCFCGRCGRILAQNIDESRVRVSNIWFDCPKCGWLNGFDMDLGWAKYVVDELRERNLSLQRVEELLTELREWQGSADAFFARNPDVAKGPVSWLARISLGTVIAILALLYAMYSTHQSDEIAKEQLHVEQQQLQVGKQRAENTLTPDDVQRIATELHRLQEEVRIKPPPRSSTRGGRRR